MSCRVAIVMGSVSDYPVMKAAVEVLSELGVETEVRAMSAHRTPDLVREYAEGAAGRGIEVIIAGAGGAAHLPGVIAAWTTLPVIGVPIKTEALGGVDSLYSIVQMPAGIPVATVGINGARNAGILAAEILGIKYPDIQRALSDMRSRMREKVMSQMVIDPARI